MKKKLFKFLIMIILIIIIFYICIESIKNSKPKSDISTIYGIHEMFNTNYFQNVYTSPPTYSSMTVGKWYYFPITSGGTPHPAYKLNSTHILMSSGNGLSGAQNLSLFYYSVSGSTATLQKNATLTINDNPYATDASGRVYPTGGNHYTPLGDYIVNLVGRDDLTGAANSYILKRSEWVKGTSWWRYYDGWGLSSADSYAGFAITSTPKSLSSFTNAVQTYTENGVSRKIRKIATKDNNISVQSYPFTIDISSRTSYKFWYGSNHTQINENYIDDSYGRHVIWPEFNNKVDPPQSGQSAKYTSGNIGVDIYDVGSYIIKKNGRDKRIKVNMRITFYWQSCPSKISYTAGGYTFSTYPSAVGVGIYPGTTNSLGILLYGLPYRAHITFFYYDDNNAETSLSVNGSIGFHDIDAGQYLGFKVNSGATIDELQCIDNSYQWTGTNGDSGTGNINYIALGRAASDSSGTYDVIGANIFQNAERVTPRSGTLNNHINYPSIASDEGPESMVAYTISDLNTIDLVVGGSKKNEAGIKYFNNIFDIPNNHTQVKANIDTAFIDEYAMADETRDGLGSNTQVTYGALYLKGVRMGRNSIPSPTIMLKDSNEEESSDITVDKAANSPNLSNYTEVISVKVPYESRITTGVAPFDNYYDSFKINQTVNSNVQIGSVSIHYYGETASLNSYFTVSVDNATHKLIVQANASGTPIYKTDAFYSNELVVEVQLSLPSASNSVWDGTTTSFSHTASITVTRTNSELSGVSNESVTNTTPTAAIAYVNRAIVNIKKDDVSWNNTEMKAALYQNNSQVYGYSEGTVTNNGSTIRWIGISEGTYDVYVSKDSNNVSEMVKYGTQLTISGL